jgi:hypothetical protein
LVRRACAFALGRNERMNAEAQLALEAAVCLSLLVGATAALVFAASGKTIVHITSVVIGAAAVAVGLVRWFVPPWVWPQLGYSRPMDDGSVLFLDSRWFFLLPVAVGAVAVVRWVFCRGASRYRPNKSRQPTAAEPRHSTP